MALYKVVRYYEKRDKHTVRGLTGLYLEQAQEHCKDPETFSRTCTSTAGKRRTRLYGPWFDGYIEDKG